MARLTTARPSTRGGPRRTRLLLAHGAKANGLGGHPVYGGRTPYELALPNGHTEVAGILAGAGAAAEPAGLGFGVNHLRPSTPLYAPAWNDNVETARTMLERGADPTIKDTDHGSTPLGWASTATRHRVAAYLRGIGRKP